MPKIQGKQLANDTITQSHLDLTTPVSGDTLSGATVEYVNEQISVVTSESGIIGTPDDGTYTDGIFTDWTSDTTVANAVDNVNEMLLLLAPSPPLTSWDDVFNSFTITSASVYSAAPVGSPTNVDYVVGNDQSVNFTLSVDSLAAEEARNATTGIFDLKLDAATMSSSSVTLDSNDDTGTYGLLYLEERDPYDGEAGKAGFWTGVTLFTVGGATPSQTYEVDPKTLTFENPGANTPSLVFYTDNPISPVVTVNSFTLPDMDAYVSGVPTLTSGKAVIGIDFDIDDAVSFFYNRLMWKITGTLVVDTAYAPPTIMPTTPTTETVQETGQSTTTMVGTGGSGVFSDTSFGFSIVGRSSNNASDTTAISVTSRRIDTISIETSRKTSGTGGGTYPAAGFGDSYVSSTSLLSNDYVYELQLKNGIYQYPNTNYTPIAGGANYTGLSELRWATFNIGSFTDNGSFVLTINGANNITSQEQTGLDLEIIIDGGSGTDYWVDGNAAFSNGTEPGTVSNGQGAQDLGYDDGTETVRKIEFGGPVYTGNIIVRIGWDSGYSFTFTSITASSIV